MQNPREQASHVFARRLSRRQFLIAVSAAFPLSSVVLACSAPAQQASPTAVPTTPPAAQTAPPRAATAAPAAPAPAKTGGTLNLSWSGAPIGFMGDFNAMSALGTSWFSKYLSSLVAWDAKFTRMEGDLAEKWEASSDQKTWTFRLHDKIRFHDGRPLTADDVDFTLHLVLNKAFPARTSALLNVIQGATDYIDGKTQRIKGIEVVNPTTIKITTGEPYAPLLHALAQTWILPKHALESMSPQTLVKSDWWKKTPIGSGPFRFVREAPGQFVEVERFPDFFRGAPKLDRIVNRIFTEPGAALLALEKGEIDFSYVAQDEARRLEGNPNITVLPGPSMISNVLIFNLADPKFKDQRVRQAFAYAIDRKGIVDKLYRGAATVINSPFALPQFVPSDLNAYPFDTNKAKALLQEANWDANAAGTLGLLVWYNDQLSQDVYAAMQQNLAAAGIKAQVRTVDRAAYLDAIGKGQFDLAEIGTADGPEPDQQRTTWFSGSPPPAGFNYTNYKNEQVDKAFLEGARTIDAGKRATIYQDIARIMNRELPGVWLWQSVRYGAVNKRVKDFVYAPAPVFARYGDYAERWSL